ncbi:MAG: hypothetical protein V1690_02525 [Candidatus Moraniibacteriota bacterium]
MQKSVLAMIVGKRRDMAVEIQKVLTEGGCIIKTRLGIHDGVGDSCSDKGLIILELVGTTKEKKKLAKNLDALYGVKTKLVELEM